MQYEWTGYGILLIAARTVDGERIPRRIVSADEPLFTGDECPAAEAFVTRGDAKRLDEPKVEKPAEKPKPKAAKKSKAKKSERKPAKKKKKDGKK